MPSFSINRYVKLLAVWLVAIGSVIMFATSTSAVAASNSIKINVYRDPACTCCGAWMEHLTTEGFQPKNISTSEMTALKQQYGVPNDLSSCHTAVLNGYIIEGHVPAHEIKRLLAEQPDILGIAVPGMPIGTPGMESGNIQEPFSVVSFDQQGKTEIFNQYSF